MALDLFSCMRSFVAVAEYNGFAPAARKLHISPPVLTKQVQWLEHRVKKPLLERTTRRVELTEAGQVYLVQAQQVLAGVAHAESALQVLETEPHGYVVLGMAGFLNAPQFIRALHVFLDQYPKISLDVRAEISPALVIEGVLDIAVSQENLSDTGLIKEPLFTVCRKIYAAPSYLKAHGVPKTIADLQHHNCLVFQQVSPVGEWVLGKHKKIKVQGNYKSNAAAHFMLALFDGFGLGWCADHLVAEDVAAGRLQEVVLTDVKPIEIPVFLYYRPSSQNLAVKRMVVHLKTIVSQHHFHRGMPGKKTI